jgi:hypothetical protein
VPAFFWSLKSALLRGDSSLVSRCSERLMTSMSMNDLMKWVEVIRRNSVFKDTILLPSSDAKLLRAVEERAQNFSEFQRDQGKNPMTAPMPAMLAGPAPAATFP